MSAPIRSLEEENQLLLQQIATMDRILEGRRVASNGIANEALILQAPFLQVRGLFDNGTPPHAIKSVRSMIQMTFFGPLGERFEVHDQSYPRDVPVGRLSAESRLVIAILGAPR